MNAQAKDKMHAQTLVIIINEVLRVNVKIPSLTAVKAKSGYRPNNGAVCSHFLFGNDLCYFFTSSVLVLFMMLCMADFEINL